ncbi:MAG: YhbY family RNA-binding protein [Ignisphaera sp.]|uniref:RNA-binding protein n=1 Tax=Ignisphaera aggregans TaxID=334771 RepID=A0A7C4H7I6_9CREN
MVKLRGLARRLYKERIRRHRADVNIGKNGIHMNLINEVKRVLEEHGIVKVRILRNARNSISDDDIAMLAKSVDGVIVDSRGYTYILISRKILKSSSRIDLERSKG